MLDAGSGARTAYNDSRARCTTLPVRSVQQLTVRCARSDRLRSARTPHVGRAWALAVAVAGGRRSGLPFSLVAAAESRSAQPRHHRTEGRKEILGEHIVISNQIQTRAGEADHARTLSTALLRRPTPTGPTRLHLSARRLGAPAGGRSEWGREPMA
jgi:hypothetical protein